MDGQEQLEYQNRQMTQREEDILGDHEDRIYRPPDMVEKPGGLWFTGDYKRSWESCFLQTALPNH